ncbi:MAG: protease SohB [Thiohalomonadaceae bacterium]
MDPFAQYALFLAKSATVVLAVLLAAQALMRLFARGRERARERLQVRHLNHRYRLMAQRIEAAMLSGADYRRAIRAWKREAKAPGRGPCRLFVLDFRGDMKASAVATLRESVTAVLLVARPGDEVVLRLESLGGMVAPYGLAASQLTRIRDKDIPLTVCVDTVAASGGYMMACVANRLLAAPFAVVGSIGVVGQLPNFHRLLKRHDIDVELFKAGDFKRTVTLFAENTPEGKRHFQGKIDDIHRLFKEFVARYRPQLDLEKVATGEYWHGSRALELGLVDDLQTSDDYLLEASRRAELYEVHYGAERSPPWWRP